METDRLEPHPYHHMEIYKDETALAGIVARLALQARHVGQPMLIIATASNRRQIDAALKALAPEGDTSDIEMLDSHQALQDILVDGRPDPLRFKEVIGTILTRLCENQRPCVPIVFADMVDVLVRSDNTSAALAMEILWNRLAADHTFSLLCGYTAANLHEHIPSDKELQEICDQHDYIRRMN